MIKSPPATFIPVSGDPNHKKFVLDIDSVELDCDDMLCFPTGTPVEVAREFVIYFLIPEVGELCFEACACRDDSSNVYGIFDPPLSPKMQEDVKNCIETLANLLRNNH